MPVIGFIGARSREEIGEPTPRRRMWSSSGSSKGPAAASGLKPHRRVAYWQILLKKSKIEGSEDLANVVCWRSRPLQGSAESMGASVVALG